MEHHHLSFRKADKEVYPFDHNPSTVLPSSLRSTSSDLWNFHQRNIRRLLEVLVFSHESRRVAKINLGGSMKFIRHNPRAQQIDDQRESARRLQEYRDRCERLPKPIDLKE